MRRIFACAFLALAMVLTAAAADVSGKWSGSFVPEGGDNSPAYIVLKQSGTSITGTAGPDENQQFAIQEGKIDGSHVTFQVTTDNGVVYKCDVMMEGDHLKGAISASREGQAMKGKLDVSRVK